MDKRQPHWQKGAVCLLTEARKEAGFCCKNLEPKNGTLNAKGQEGLRQEKGVKVSQRDSNFLPIPPHKHTTATACGLVLWSALGHNHNGKMLMGGTSVMTG
jgi:hypothetical protein